ncbi:OLC1v1034300C1 [Oldenlandia corymbosa var. corymbosa]|uniref:OLC1v1034300C1 n=1 Tax=Oldenlandia corymbosa var. corymbosa TaxID=529605 RepID=A0AAV1CRK2_OLDCO|nr:OLC1v1034300C1 [Oldenlandia corymbosa var. corymbosa]
MAAPPKHLHELLQQDQEPFQLKNYINDRRSQLKRPTPTTTTNYIHPNTTSSSSAIQIKKRNPVSLTNTNNSTISKRSLCKHACFFSFNDSPDVRKSPFPDFRSPAKSPCSTSTSSGRTKNGTVYLHVPARTAALLLEAAMRIQKQQSSPSSSSILKPKSQNKNMGFGLFSSIIKKLKDRSRNRKCGIQGTESEIPAKLEVENVAGASSSEEVCSCSYHNSRLSSAGWSESNEEKSLDMETSTSSYRSPDYEGMDFGAQHSAGILSCSSCESQFCSSPLSPFRFSLQKSPSSGGRRTPDFSPPAASPSRRRNEGKKKLYEGNGFAEESKQVEPEEEEEKEQCSPVSVLDPPFEDEDDGHEEEDEEDEDEDYDDDLECSFAFVQRAKEQLLHKLRRFEKLAELDPIELEKRMMEQLDGDDENESEDNVEEEKCAADNEFPSPSMQRGSSSNSYLDSFVNEVCIKSSLQSRRKLPTDMKRLVSDLISEENREVRFLDNKEMVVGRVCKKLDSWKEVESNTIDMMVELDFRTEMNEWKKFQEQRDEIAVGIEFAIFGELLDQLSEELLLL